MRPTLHRLTFAETGGRTSTGYSRQGIQMRVPPTIAAAAVVLSTVFNPISAHAGSACESNAMPNSLLGICQTPLFKAYVACIEKAIPVWDPKGEVLRKKPFGPGNSVLAVLVECEPIALKFGKKYGDDLANTLQSIANQRVSKQYGTAPLKEPEGSDLKPGDIVVPLRH
jgi:hypothetical protein